MTIKELLKKGPEELEAMSDNELREYFKPFLKYIVPVEIEKETSTRTLGGNRSVKQKADSTKTTSKDLQRTFDLANEMAKKLGIKL